MPPPGVRYGGPPPPPPPPPRGYPPPYPYPGMMPPLPPPQYVGDGYPPPHPHGYPPRHQPNVGDNHHRKGGGSFDGQKKNHDGYKKKKKNHNFEKRRSNDSNYGYRSPNNFGQQQQQQPIYGGGGGASSSPHYNNRYPKHHDKKGGDTNTNDHRNETVLNPFDFPGLDGKAASESTVKAATASDEKLVGYASALLKKNEKVNHSSTTKATAASSALTSSENGDDDNNMTRQTEAMEKEILSEFHDLSIHESDPVEQHHGISNNNDKKQCDTPIAVDKTDGCNTVETSPSSTENGVVSPQSATNDSNSSPILPETVIKSPSEENPRVDLEEGEGSSAVVPPPAAAETVKQHKVEDDIQVNDKKEQNAKVERPAAPAAWGSKRLFADVVASQK